MQNISPKELGRKITSVRKLRRLTQRELADKLNIHPSMVTRWEKGQMYPKDSTLEAIAGALGLSTEELLNAKSSPEIRVYEAPAGDQELQVCLELLDRMGEEDRRVVKHMIQALAFRHQVQSLGKIAG